MTRYGKPRNQDETEDNRQTCNPDEQGNQSPTPKGLHTPATLPDDVLDGILDRVATFMYATWSARWTMGKMLPPKKGRKETAAKAHTLACLGAYLQNCIQEAVFATVGIPPGWSLIEIEVKRIKHAHRLKPERNGKGEKLVVVVLQTKRPFTTSFTPKKERDPTQSFNLDKEGMYYCLEGDALTNHRRTSRVDRHTASYVLRLWVGARP